MHALLIIALCCLPLAVLILLWLLDAGREPDNAITQEQENRPRRQDPDDALTLAA
jgi:hypothetical protein